MNVTHPHRVRRAIGALAAAAVLLAACGTDDGTSDTTAATDATDTTAATDAAVAVTTDDADTPETAPVDTAVPADGPERIVSLSSSLTEMAYAVGAGDQVVAVDQYSNHPPGTPITDLSGFRPNLEAILGYEPDLVLVGSDRDGIVAALENAGVATVLLARPETADEAIGQIEIVAEATGHAGAGATVAAEVRAGIDEIVAEAATDVPLTYYYELSDTHHSLTTDTFVGSLLALIGLENIADGVDPAAGGYPQLTAEHILGSDPDLIFVVGIGTGSATVDEVAARPGWDRLTAVREDRVIELDEDLASRWGPRMVDLLDLVAETVADSGAR